MFLRKLTSLLNGVLLVSCFIYSFQSAAKQKSGDMEQLIIIALDGTDSRWVNPRLTPFLHSLMQRGSSTLAMKNIVPTITAPNFTTSLTGTLPEVHGVYTNNWTRGSSTIPPSVFDLFSDDPSSVLIVSDDWDYYRDAFALPPKKEYPHLILKRSGDSDQNYIDNARATVELARRTLAESSPRLVFLYLQHVDHIGHTTGWGSRDYVAALTQTDTWLNSFVQAVDPQRTNYIMFMTDHGGKLFHHANGDNIPDIRNIPWIIAGPRIVQGKNISGSRTTQIAPTVAMLFRKNSFAEWLSPPVSEIFK